MCGLCGELRFDGGVPDLATIERMRAALAPRGPDAAGAFAHGAVALGHRRLEVMDTTDLSLQPMFDPGLGIALVFNGAVYNHAALRAELEGLGYRFWSRGDTEVVLKAWHAWGERFVERLNGMFALALWERDSGRLVLARDRLGIKPLYWTGDGARLRFASTLPALLAAGGIDTAIDPVALHHYMTFHSVVPAPRTVLAGVRKLDPATLAVIEPDGRRRERRYWEARFERDAAERARSGAEWRELVLERLRTAVRRRLVAEVPVGVLLSGGVDSSLVVGLLAEAGQRDLRTYSVGFESVAGTAGDEFEFSDLVAERFATDHHRIRVPGERVVPAVERAVDAMSEPMVSHDAVGFWLLSERVSEDITVVQSGQGADEVFGGYHWYPPMLASTAPAADYARAFFDRDHAEYARAVDPALHVGDESHAFVEAHFARDGAETPADRALRIDTEVMLVDDPVKRVDNMTMAFGLEARVPFLDHDLVELAARVPPEEKIRGGGKHVLKEAARDVLPAAVVDRPKGYFPVPALSHLRGDVLDFVREVLERPEARARGVFDRGYVDALIQDPDAHVTPLGGSKLWQITCLELWMQRHEVR